MPETTNERFDLSSECLALGMQNCGDRMFMGFEKICLIAHGRQTPQLLEKLSSRLDRPAATDPSTLSIVEFSATQIQYLDFFSDKTAEFIDLNKRAGLRLGLVDWQLPSSLDKPAGESFVMHSRILPMPLSSNPSRYSF